MQYSADQSGFVALAEAIPEVILDIRYYSGYNFVGGRIDGYDSPIALITREAADALRLAAADLRQRGYLLKIFDAYRPQQAVDHFMRWAKDETDTRMKPYFYPDLEKSRLIPDGYLAVHSGHTRGSTVDLTLFDMDSGREADLGGPFDFFGPVSHFDCRTVSSGARSLRELLRGVMGAHGFRPLAEEWWHFTLENEPFPDTYFTFPVR